MPPKLHEAAAAPESSHSCCVGKYGNTTVQVMHNARHRPLLLACTRRPPVSFPARLFHRVPGPCVQIAKRRAYEKQFAYMDSMPQTATALKKTLAPRRVGGQQ